VCSTTPSPVEVGVRLHDPSLVAVTAQPPVLEPLGPEHGAAVGAFVAGTAAWRWIAQLKFRWSGAVAGAVTGVAAHPLAWYAFMVGLSGARSSLSEPTVNPLEAVPGALVFSVMSCFIAGWLTVPVGGALGFGLSRALRAFAAGADSS